MQLLPDNDPAGRAATARRSVRWLLDADNVWAVNGARLITLIGLFALWEIGGGWLFDTFYFSKPSLIAKAFEDFVTLKLCVGLRLGRHGVATIRQ